MERTRRTIFVAAVTALAMLVPAAAIAAPTVYVTPDPGHTAAFAAEGARVSVLGVDFPIYCSFVEPAQKRKPRAFHPLAAPLLMRPGPSGLTASFDDSEGRDNPATLGVTASWGGDALAGSFQFVASEKVVKVFSHCQSASYYPGEASVAFEAPPFVPFGEPGAAAPSIDEVPVFFSEGGPLEFFARQEGGRMLIRGVVTSKCRFGGGHESTRTPFAGVADPLRLDDEGRFLEQRHLNGRPDHGAHVEETIRMSGVVHESAIDGIYFRRSSTGEGKGARECKIGPLHFHADRYLPPAS